MMFFKSAFTLSALLMLASAMTLERSTSNDEKSILIFTPGKANTIKTPAFAITKTDCEKDDEADCKEFCGLSEQTATCSANGNKVTCYCKGGKSESNCEDRCLLCMPDKMALEEASRLFKLGGSKMEL